MVHPTLPAVSARHLGKTLRSANKLIDVAGLLSQASMLAQGLCFTGMGRASMSVLSAMQGALPVPSVATMPCLANGC